MPTCATTLASRRVSTKAWHKLLGELRSMVLGIPGGQGLFSQLQLVLRSREHHRVRIHQEARHQLLDLQLLADDLAARPTCIAEVVPAAPHYIGCSDAALSGMGGVWFPPPGGHGHPPYVWRAPFPSHIQSSLVSDRNPSPIPTWNSSPLSVTSLHWPSTTTSASSLWPPSVTTHRPSPGAPKVLSPPRARRPICSALRAFTSAPTAILRSASTFRALPMSWPTLPPDALTCLTLPFLRHSTLVLPILSLGRCFTCRPICVCD